MSYTNQALGSALIEGRDFVCSATVCKAQPGTDIDKVFNELQRQLNRFSKMYGFSPLIEDGILGAKTLAAYRTVYAQSSINITDVATHPGLAVVAMDAIGFLQAEADASGLPYIKPSPITTAVATVKKALKKVAPPSPKTDTGRYIWWGVGIASLVAIGSIGYKTYQRRKGS